MGNEGGILVADRYMTLAEIAANLRISQETARRVVIDGKLEGFQVRGPGSMWRIETRSFREYLSKSRKDGDAAENAAEDTINKIA